MSAFFSRLSYSFGNEDWRTEQLALKIQPDDRVLCITASGDRPLNLLLNPCHEIVCIDANPIQNYLLQLKMAAMKTLDYQDYLTFLGAVPGKKRKDILQKLIPQMDPAAAQFWKDNGGIIERGVLYQGAVERLTKLLAKCTNLIRRRKVKKLFAISDLDEQKKFVRDEWDGIFWRKLFEVVLNPLIFTRFIIEDPGLVNVTSIKPGTYLYERILDSLDRVLAKENLLLSLILMGKVYPEAYPPYLLEKGVETIKPRLNKLKIETSNVIDYLESINQPAFDVFSLSDVISYLSPSDYHRLMNAMIKTAKPGARFCLREFMSTHEIPPQLEHHFIRDRSLEKSLESQDNCFVYRFMVGGIETENAKKIDEDQPVKKAELISV